MLRYREDPVLFFKEVLGKDTHWEKQIDIARSVAKHRKTTVRSGHDVGKSFVAADIALWYLQCFPNSIVITTAPTWRQVEKVLWGEIGEHFNKSKVKLSGKLLETEIKIGPKWYAMGFSSDKPDAFQGFHEGYILVIVDEPSGVEDATAEQIDSLTANVNARLLLIGNPIRSNGFFSRSFSDPTFNHIHINCLESPNVKAGKIIYKSLVTKEWCQEKLEEWGKDSAFYQSRVLGNFPKETEDTLIFVEWIERSYNRWTKFVGQKLSGAVTISCDVARKGKNFTVIIVRVGRRIVEIKSYLHQDTYATAKVLESLIKKYEEYPDMHVIIDDNGVGGGVTDDLNAWGYEKIVVPVVAGENAIDSGKYFNRKAEMAWNVRMAFRNNEIDVPPPIKSDKNTEKLVFECSNQYYDHTKEGSKLRVMSKSMLKKKGMESPDWFEALSLNYALEMPESLAKKKTPYNSIFVDDVHVTLLNSNLKIGVSFFQSIVALPSGASAIVWACADRKGLVYVYDEALIWQASSSDVAKVTFEHEEQFPRAVEERYTKKFYSTQEVQNARYLLVEQLEDHDIFVEEVEYNPELSMLNIREGLKFNKNEPINNLNHPYIFFHPRCQHTINAMKFYFNPGDEQNNPVLQAFHEAVGVLVLTEPVWTKVYQ